MKILFLLLMLTALVSCGEEVADGEKLFAQLCQQVNGVDSTREVIEYNEESDEIRYGAFFYTDTTTCEQAELAAGIRYQGSISSGSLSLDNLGQIVLYNDDAVTLFNGGSYCAKTDWSKEAALSFLGPGTLDISFGSCASSLNFYGPLEFFQRYQSEDSNVNENSISVDVDGDKGIKTFVLLGDSEADTFSSLMNSLFTYPAL